MNTTSNYKKYHSKNPLKYLMIKRFEKKILLMLEKENQNTLLLDAGCGEGFISDIIYKNTNIKDITGIDINDDVLEFAKNNNKNINYFNKDIYNLKGQDKHYDIVLVLEVLEHLKAPKIALNNLYKITNDKLIISVPNEPLFSLGNLLSFKNIKTLGTPKDHINKWTKKQFIAFLKDNGIQNIDIKKNVLFPWIIIIINKNNNKPKLKLKPHY